MTLLDQAAVSYLVVLTKADKVKAADLEDIVRATTEVARRHVAAHPTLLVTSAETGAGLAELRAELARLAEAPAAAL